MAGSRAQTTTTTEPKPVDVHVSGRVRRPDAGPAARLPVPLTAEHGIAEQLFGGIVVDLGSPAAIGLVVARGCDGPAATTANDDNGRPAWLLLLAVVVLTAAALAVGAPRRRRR